MKTHRLIQLLLSEVPYSQYEHDDTTQKQFDQAFIDFRFQILFKDDKQSYKKFYRLYNAGKPMYARFKGKFLKITSQQIKKVSKVVQEYCLPDNWYKVAKIVK